MGRYSTYTADPILSCIVLIYVLILLASLWIIFQKANRPGIYAIIPIVSYGVLFEIAGHPWWWVFGLLIPFVNVILLIILYLDLAKSFSQGEGFGCGMILLPFIFVPLLAFGDYQYIGNDRNNGSGYSDKPKRWDM